MVGLRSATLAALAAALAVVPLAAADAKYGEEGVPVTAACATDGSGEAMHATAGSMFFPGRGCSATFAVGDATDITAVTFQGTGHVGQVCGLFEFGGGFVGLSELECAPHDSIFEADVNVTRANGTTFTVTWIPTSWRHDNAYLCSMTTDEPDPVLPPGVLEPACAAWEPDAECLPGLDVTTSAGHADLDWPDVEGTYYYNASATRLDPKPVRLWNAETVTPGSAHTFGQDGGTYSYVVTAFDTDHLVVATFCQVTMAVPPGPPAEVPFFTGPWALGIGLGAVLVAGAVLVRRRA